MIFLSFEGWIRYPANESIEEKHRKKEMLERKCDITISFDSDFNVNSFVADPASKQNRIYSPPSIDTSIKYKLKRHSKAIEIR